MTIGYLDPWGSSYDDTMTTSYSKTFFVAMLVNFFRFATPLIHQNLLPLSSLNPKP